MLLRFICILYCLATPFALFSQLKYTLNGNAIELNKENRFRLTNAIDINQHGTVWHNVQIDLNNSFVLLTKLNFGDIDALGADGIGFGFQQDGTEAGTPNNGLEFGLGGIRPSLFVEFDTWANIGIPEWNTDYNDSIYDHLSIFRDGYFKHGSPNEVIEPRRILDGIDNVEDGQDYLVRFEWDAVAKIFKVSVNCQERISLPIDIVNEIFNGNSIVNWGFGAATGFAKNSQEVEILHYTTELEDKVLCRGGSVAIGDPELETVTDLFYQWSPAEGVERPNAAVTNVSPTENTTYTLTVSDACGVVAVKDVDVEVTEEAELTIDADKSELCPDSSLTLTVNSDNIRWSDGSTTNPRIINEPDYYEVESTGNCPGQTAINIALIEPLPTSFLPSDTVLCGDATLQIDLTALPSQIQWNDGVTGNQRTLEAGQYIATISNTCGISTDTITIGQLDALQPFLPADTAICPGETYSFELAGLPGIIQWDDGEASNMRTLLPGTTYIGTLSNACGSLTDTIIIEQKEGFETAPFSFDSLFCGDSLLLDFDSIPHQITWSDGVVGNTRWFKPGTYDASIGNSCGDNTSRIVLSNEPTLPRRFLPDDRILCPGEQITIDLRPWSPAVVRWADGSDLQLRDLGEGTFIATLSNTCYMSADTISIRMQASLDSLLPDDFTLCVGDSTTIQLPDNASEWEDGAPLQRKVGIGQYVAHYDNGCISIEDTLVVSGIEPPPSVFLPSDTALCTGDVLTISADFYTPFELSWEDGLTQQTRNLAAGSYIASLQGQCGTSRDTLVLETIPVPSDTFLPADTVLCPGALLNIDLSAGPMLEWSDGEQTNNRQVGVGNYTVRKPYACGFVTDVLNIQQHPTPPATFLPTDTTICETDSILLAVAPLANMQIQWSDNVQAWARKAGANQKLEATITNICGKSEDAINIIGVPKVPKHFLPIDTVLCAGTVLMFDPAGLPGTFNWADDFTGIERTLAPGETYEARLQNICGVEQDKVIIGLSRNCANVFLPNIFAPDRINQKFGLIDPDGIVRNIQSFEIYNRWGARVYQAKNIDLMHPAASWDGENNPAGVYVYSLMLEVEPGITIYLKGDVTLIR